MQVAQNWPRCWKVTQTWFPRFRKEAYCQKQIEVTRWLRDYVWGELFDAHKKLRVKKTILEESQQQLLQPPSFSVRPQSLQPFLAHLLSLTKKERRRRPRKRISSKLWPKKSLRCKMTTRWSLARSHDRHQSILTPMIFCLLMANLTWCFRSLMQLIKVLKTTKEKTFKSIFASQRPSLLVMLLQLVFRRLAFLVIWLQIRVSMLWWAELTK